jgi:uncharacterized protein YidB (DUF937 family)
MGFLDHLFSEAGKLSDVGNPADGHAAKLVPLLLSALGGGEGQSAQVKGLSGLIDRFHQAGLGEVAQSWISNQASNQPVTPDQVHAALGEQQIAALAEKMGLPKSGVTSVLAGLLPKLVDSLTPNGQLPHAPDTRPIQQASGAAQGPGEAAASASRDSGIGEAVEQSDPTEPVQSAANED